MCAVSFTGSSNREIARIVDALGQQTFVVGNAPATANLVKLAGNAMSAVTLEILGEVLALARKRGLDPRELLSVLTGTMFGSRVHKIYGGKIAEQQFAVGGFIFPLALKDVRLALNEAEAAGVPMPSVSVVRDRLIAGIARGYSDRDWSACSTSTNQARTAHTCFGSINSQPGLFADLGVAYASGFFTAVWMRRAISCCGSVLSM